MSDEHRSGTLENWATAGALEIKVLRGERDRLKEENARLRAALERIERFNPSYEYTFENAREIAREALGK